MCVQLWEAVETVMDRMPDIARLGAPLPEFIPGKQPFDVRLQLTFSDSCSVSMLI